VVIPLTVAALGVCWLLAWLALLLVFMWLVRRRSDAVTLRIFVELAETWRMPAAPLQVLARAAGRRCAHQGGGRGAAERSRDAGSPGAG
jgi:hypothetical protein